MAALRHLLSPKGRERIEKRELEALLRELDEALMRAFPDPDQLSGLVVGGACLLFQDVINRSTEDVDLIIFEMMGNEENFLIFHSRAQKLRRIIKRIGKNHGLKGKQQMFLNDDCASFLLELSENELPPMRLLKAYRKIRLYVPTDLRYILACKFMTGRPKKDLADIEVLCRTLAIHNREQAQSVVNHYFPSPIHQALYQLSETLDRIFE